MEFRVIQGQETERPREEREQQERTKDEVREAHDVRRSPESQACQGGPERAGAKRGIVVTRRRP